MTTPTQAARIRADVAAKREALEAALGELLKARRGAAYAAVVVHLGDGLPDEVLVVKAEKPHRKPARRPSPRKSR